MGNSIGAILFFRTGLVNRFSTSDNSENRFSVNNIVNDHLFAKINELRRLIELYPAFGREHSFNSMTKKSLDNHSVMEMYVIPNHTFYFHSRTDRACQNSQDIPDFPCSTARAFDSKSHILFSLLYRQGMPCLYPKQPRQFPMDNPTPPHPTHSQIRIHSYY